MSEQTPPPGEEIYSPLSQRNPLAWYPHNDGADILVRIRHIWFDMLALQSIIQSRQKAEERHLLLKYFVIELRSLFQAMDDLARFVNTSPNRQGCSSGHSTYPQEKAEANQLFKVYGAAVKKVEKDVLAIRNKIGAHRDALEWPEMVALYDKLMQGGAVYKEVTDSIPPIIAYVAALDLFAFSRSTKSDTVEVMTIRFRPGDYGDETASPAPTP